MVFTNPEDLITAVLNQVNPQPVMVPTIADQMAELIKPGRAVDFRTESGSLYELTCFTGGRPTELRKVEHADRPGGMRLVATGEVLGVRDRQRGVSGIRIDKTSGGFYTTSAIVKIWLAFDATVEGPDAFHTEPS